MWLQAPVSVISITSISLWLWGRGRKLRSRLFFCPGSSAILTHFVGVSRIYSVSETGVASVTPQKSTWLCCREGDACGLVSWGTFVMGPVTGADPPSPLPSPMQHPSHQPPPPLWDTLLVLPWKIQGSGLPEQALLGLGSAKTPIPGARPHSQCHRGRNGHTAKATRSPGALCPATKLPKRSQALVYPRQPQVPNGANCPWVTNPLSAVCSQTNPQQRDVPAMSSCVTSHGHTGAVHARGRVMP